MPFHLTHWPIARQLGLIIMLFCIAICSLLLLSSFAMEALSGTRAYVGGEALWSKSQKAAAFRLSRYVYSGDEEDYRQYEHFIAIPLGDQQARLELLKKEGFQRQRAVNGFLKGRNHPDDIPIMIRMVRWFPTMYPIRNVLEIWAEGDAGIAQIQSLAGQIRSDRQKGVLTPEQQNNYHRQIQKVDAELTPLEESFSYTLGMGARWIKRNVLWGMIGLTTLSLAIIVGIAYRIIRRICQDLQELKTAAVRVGQGDFSSWLQSGSENELGDLFRAFQGMTKHRQEAEKQVMLLNEQLKNNVQDLEDFAYSVAHDLRTPLRSLDGFAAMLRDELQGQLNPDTTRYLQRIREKAQTMGRLIDDLLRLSHLSRTPMSSTHIPMADIARETCMDLISQCPEREIRWTVNEMPSVPGDIPLVRQMWINLISNAIKFTRPRDPAVIEIGGRIEGSSAMFYIQDNGVGFDMQYVDKLFGVFQRLHSQNDFEGTGAGLSIVRRIAERHGGRVWAQSRMNEGATFYLSLPLRGTLQDRGALPFTTAA